MDRSDAFARARISILFAFSLAGITVGSLSTRLAEIKLHIGASDGTYGTAFAFYPLGAFVGFFLASRAIHRFGTRTILRTIFYLLIAVNFSYSIVPTISLFALNAFIGGIAYSIFNTSMNSQAVLVEQFLKKSFLPRAHAYWSLGAVSGAFFSSLIAPFLSVTMTFICVDLFCIMVWLMIHRGFLPSGFDDQPHTDPTQLPQKKRIPITTRNFLFLLAVGQSLSMLAEGTAGDWSSVLLHEDLGIAIGPNGYAFATFSLVQLVTRYFAPNLIDKRGLHKVVRSVGTFGLAGFLSCHVAANAADSRTLALIFSCMAFGFMSFGLAVMVPAYATAAGSIPRLPSARALVVIGAAGSVILWVGRIIFSYFAQIIGLPIAIGAVAFVAMGAVYLAKYVDPVHIESKAINPEHRS